MEKSIDININFKELLKDFRNVCNEISKENEEEIILSETKTNYKYLREEIDSIIKTINLAKDKQKSKKELKSLLFFYDFFLLNQIAHYLIIHKEVVSKERKILWNHKQTNKEFFREPSIIYLMYKANQINFTLSIRELLESGFDTQANILARSKVEYTDICLLLLCNEDFSTNFCRIPENGYGSNQKRKLYEKYMKPSKVKVHLNEVFEKMGIDKELREILERKKSGYYYDWLSEFSHGELETSCFAIMPFNNSDDPEFNLFGGYSIVSKYTMIDFLFWNTMSLFHELNALDKFHNFAPNGNEEDIDDYKSFKYQFNIFKKIYFKYYFKYRSE
ncbi:MAG: hypothetical protein KOO66_05410 [Bacteroidales bacterium]|nr:hypothetical protein [Bacteroidales bacterium]